MDNNTKQVVKNANEKKKMSKRKKTKRILISIIAFSLFFLIYLCSVYYFSNHYFYKTRINGEDCSFLTDSEVRRKINRKVSLYELEIVGKDGVTDVIRADDIGLSFVYDNNLTQVREKENPFLWMTAFFTGYDFELTNMAEFDKTMFEEVVSDLVFYDEANMKKAKNAYIGEYDENIDGFVIVKEEGGSEPDDEKLRLVLAEAITSLQDTVYLEPRDCYKKAEILSDNSELLKEVATLNSFLGAKITYDWNGATEVVDGQVISQWLVQDGETIYLDEEKVADYVAQKSEEHDTYGKDRSFTTTDGRVVIIKGGNYGWKTDVDEEKAALLEAVRQGLVLDREPVYSRRAVHKGEDDIGDSFVEMDLTAQHLYLYIDGMVVLETDFVSGNVGNGWTTPSGVYGITYKTKNAVLRGENYETPVKYWMPFNGNIGMHDATWRGSFGGNIYLTNGSHGCINLPLDAAAYIYDYMSEGFPVVCYY